MGDHERQSHAAITPETGADRYIHEAAQFDEGNKHREDLYFGDGPVFEDPRGQPRGWRAEARWGSVHAPTLVIFGERDRYLGPELAEPYPADVPNLERVVRIPQASHWVHHDEPERVTQLLAEFFRAEIGPPTLGPCPPD